MDNTENKPIISIVLPVYNGERFLSQAIDSILAQSFCDWELIIVNDHSTDGSRAIMAEYEERDVRIRVIDNPDNLKLPRSLNAGFREAKGDYFTWTSDDNLLKPQMLENLFTELESDDSIGMVYSDHDDIDEDGNFICKRTLGEPDDMRKTGNVCGASFLYRKEVADMVGEYDPDLFLAEDYDYWMRVYSVAGIKHVRECLYSCRRHEGSLTATKQKQIALQTRRAIEKNFWPMLKMTRSRKERYDLYNMLYVRAYDKKDRRELRRYVKDLTAFSLMIRFKRIQRAIKRRVGK